MFLGWVALSTCPMALKRIMPRGKNRFTELEKKTQNGAANNTQLLSFLRPFGHLSEFVKPRKSQACFDLQSRSCLIRGGGGEGRSRKGPFSQCNPNIHLKIPSVERLMCLPTAILSAYCIGQPRSC